MYCYRSCFWFDQASLKLCGLVVGIRNTENYNSLAIQPLYSVQCTTYDFEAVALPLNSTTESVLLDSAWGSPTEASVEWLGDLAELGLVADKGSPGTVPVAELAE